MVTKKKTTKPRTTFQENNSKDRKNTQKVVRGKKTTTKKAESKKEKYFQAVGRRKTAVARVRLFDKGDKSITVNEKDYKAYFSTLDLQQIVESPLSKMKIEEKFKVISKVKGGGIHAQAEAVRHGISRALVKLNEDFKKRLRKAGFLTRDPRMRERKKPGLKRARRAPQWSKR